MMNIFSFFGKYIISIKRRKKMNALLKTGLVISIIGCINWGLVGIFDFNLVEYLFGDNTLLTRLVYIIVLISGLLNIAILTKNLDR